MDANNDDYPDNNGQWDSFYVNAGDSYWREFVRTGTVALDGVAGGDHIINTLGCDGLFLDTIDTASPWGNYGDTAQGMSGLVKAIRGWYPDRYLIANRGLFYFDPTQTAHEWTIRPYINGDMFECYYTEWDYEQDKGAVSPYFPANNKTYWASIVNGAAGQVDGFTTFVLDYLNKDQMGYDSSYTEAKIGTQIDETIVQQGWVDHISTINLDVIRFDVYNYLHGIPVIMVTDPPVEGGHGRYVLHY